MQAFEHQLREAGYLAKGRQIVDATLVSAPKAAQHRRKAAIKVGKLFIRTVAPCQGARQTDAGQPGLQLRPRDLPKTSGSHGLGTPEIHRSG